MKHNYRIPIFKLEFSKQFRQDFHQGCEQIFNSDALSNGNYVHKFEAGFNKFIGTSYSIAVYSGTSALEIGLRALEVENKEVIVPTNTFTASAIAVERAGGKLVLADIEADTFSLAPAELEHRISKKTGAVMIVHIGGIISKYIGDLLAICKKHNVPLIEDAAHAHGSVRGNYKAGTIGVIGCFSFFPTKAMTTGEGGIVTTQSKHLADKLISLRNFGRDPKNSHAIITPGGTNHKMTEFQALLGCLELTRVKKRMQKRTKLAHLYQKLLDIKGYEPVRNVGDICSYYKQIVKTDLPQKKLHEFCKSHGISLTGEVYHILVHEQPIYRKQFSSEKFPVAEKFARSHICPPVYPELTLNEVTYVCSVLKDARKKTQ